MKTLVFSDVHLKVSPNGRDTLDAFVAFLRGIDASEVDRIVILGDLFDFWFEYKHVIFSGYFDVLCAFAELREAGVEFHFFCGNHDFWAGRFLVERLDFSIYSDPTILDFGRKRVLLVHGDGIDPDDRAYRVYRAIARAKPVVWLFRLIHPDWAMALAQRVSHGSRQMFGAQDASQGSQVAPLRRFAMDALAAGKADAVMCGHTHYAVLEEHPTPTGTGLYINTGDWLLNRSYVEWDESGFHLRRYEPETCSAAAGDEQA